MNEFFTISKDATILFKFIQSEDKNEEVIINEVEQNYLPLNSIEL